MGKMIVLNSDVESDNDSLELINPVLNLSLEHKDKNKSIDDQTNQLEKLDLNKKVSKRNHRSRHHPYQRHKIQNIKQDYNISYLKSFGYIKYSSSKKFEDVKISNDKDQIRSLYVQVNHSIKQIFSKHLQSSPNDYICNRRFR